jgi:hypothetical protein
MVIPFFQHRHHQRADDRLQTTGTTKVTEFRMLNVGALTNRATQNNDFLDFPVQFHERFHFPPLLRLSAI